jgi:hypothetical protein
MSMASTVLKAINVAQQSLGDLVVDATLVKASRTYDVATGRYVNASVNTPIKGVLDKFDYTEQLAPDFDVNQLKFNVFNPNNDLVIATADSIILAGVTYAINKIQRTYVGTYVPVLTLYLRK